MNFLFAFIIGFAILTVIDGHILAQSDDKSWELFKVKYFFVYTAERVFNILKLLTFFFK
jgi:hypothetical protein